MIKINLLPAKAVKRDTKNREFVIISVVALVAVAMFGFGYALVPLYNLACQALGLNGKTGRVAAVSLEAVAPTPTRTITIEFTGNATTGLPWEFRPMTKRIDLPL